jgi:hypothetical protein
MAAARARRHDDDDTPKPPSDAYVGLLVISLIAMITGSVFLYLDYSSYEGKAPKVPDRPPPLVTPGTPK